MADLLENENNTSLTSVKAHQENQDIKLISPPILLVEFGKNFINQHFVSSKQFFITQMTRIDTKPYGILGNTQITTSSLNPYTSAW